MPVVEPGKPESTICRIRDLDSPSPADGTYPVIAEAEARCHPRDGFSKEKGRRLALTRALDELGNVATLAFYAPVGSPKRRMVRYAFWEAYWASKTQTVGPVEAVAAVREWLRRMVRAEEAELDATGASETDWCQVIRALDPILASAARGRILASLQSVSKAAEG